jgi:hypothetical protein
VSELRLPADNDQRIASAQTDGWSKTKITGSVSLKMLLSGWEWRPCCQRPAAASQSHCIDYHVKIDLLSGIQMQATSSTVQCCLGKKQELSAHNLYLHLNFRPRFLDCTAVYV